DISCGKCFRGFLDLVSLGATTENTDSTEFHGKKHRIPLRLRNNTERIRKRETPVEIFSGVF
ncbi:MAG: hypothetical protein O0X93_06305, partial [Methanocorpusculum sp.]|nr:hypothetical protein [Methanocorpusculum sp.]